MTINNAASSSKCKLSPSQTLTTCMALHCAINGIGASGESVMTASPSRHQGDNAARKKRSPVEKRPKKAKIHSPKERRATVREKKIAEKKLNTESNAALSASSDLNFQPSDLEFKKLEKSRAGRQTSTLPLDFAPRPNRNIEKLEGVEPNLNHHLHQAEINGLRRDAWKFEEESDGEEDAVTDGSSVVSALNKVSCLGLLSESLPIRVASAVTCLAGLTEEAPIRHPQGNPRPRPERVESARARVGEGYDTLPSVLNRFSEFMAALEAPNAKINPITLIERYKTIKDEADKHKVENYIARHFTTLKDSLIALSNKSNLGSDDKLQEYIELLRAIHFKKNHSLYTTSDAILFYSDDQISFNDFLDFMVNTTTQSEKQIATWNLNNMRGEIDKYLNTITNELDKKIERKTIDFFINRNTQAGSDIYHFFDAESDENIYKELSSIIVKLADHEANPRYHIYKEILLSYPEKVTRYLSSENFNAKTGDEKNAEYTYLNRIRKEATFVSILEKFNHDLTHGIDADRCKFVQVEALINLFDLSERTKAAMYLSQNLSLITEYKASQTYANYSDTEKAAQDLKLNTLLGNTPAVNSFSSTEDIANIQNALQILSNPETLAKAKESYLGGGNLAAADFVNTEYLKLQDAKNFLIANPDLTKKHINSDSYKNLDRPSQNTQLELIKTTYLEKNRELFKAGVVGPSIDLVTENTAALELPLTNENEINFIRTIANLPTVKAFLDDLKSSNTKMTLSELIMLKRFIQDSVELGMDFDNETIDALIDFNYLLTWLEQLFRYQYKIRANKSLFGQDVNLAYENEFSQLTLGERILAEINKLKAGTETCDIENIIIPPLPSDLMVNFVSQVLKYKQTDGYPKLMDLAFRYDFLNKVKMALTDSFEGREVILTQTLLQMIKDESLPQEERTMAGLLYASALKKNALFKGPFNTAMFEVIYNDIMQGKPYSSLTSEQIQGLGIGNSLYEMLSALTNPLHMTMKEWITSAQNLADGSATACDIARPLTATIMDIVPFRGQVQKVKSKLSNRASSSTKLTSHIDIVSVKADVLKIATDNNFSQTHIKKLLTKMEGRRIDPQIQKIIVLESLILDMDKRVELSKLSKADYARVVADIRTYYPKLFRHKIFSFDTEANLMRIELIQNRNTLGIDKGKLMEFLNFADSKGINIESAKVLIAEHLELNYIERQKFTKLDYPKYVDVLNTLTEHHPEAITQCISKLEELSPTTSTSISDLRRLVKKDNSNIDFDSEPELKKYIYEENFKTPPQNPNLLLLSLAEYYGDISKQVLKKLEDEKTTTHHTNSIHRIFDRWGNKIGETDNINLLTHKGSKFILKKQDGNNHHQLFYLQKETDVGKNARLYSSQSFQIDGITTKQLGDNHYYVELDLANTSTVMNWLRTQDNLKYIDPAYLKSSLFNYLDVHKYSELTTGLSIRKINKVLKIDAKGEPGVTFTPAGMLDAEGIVDYLYLHNYLDTRLPDLVELNADFSGSGGIISSQAQALANKLGVSVAGYNGVVSADNRIVFTPQNNHHLKSFVENSNKKLNKKTTDQISKAQSDFASKKIPIFLDKEPVIETKNYAAPNAEVTAKINEIKNLVKGDTNYNVLITNPAGKCLDAAKVIGALIKDKSDFKDIEYISMMIYEKFPTKNTATDAGNHYAVKATYKDIDVVIDITAAQFPSINSPHEGTIDTYSNWIAKYQQGFSPASKLVKIHTTKTLSNAHFTVFGRSPFEEVKKAEVEVLSDAKWYTEDGIQKILELEKKKREHSSS